MQLSLIKPVTHLAALFDKQYLLLTGFGFCLGVLVLNSVALAILLPFALLFGLSLIVSPEIAFLAIVMSIPVALELAGGLTVTIAVMPVAFFLLALNASIFRCRWPVSLSSTEEVLALLFFFILGVSSLLADNVMLAIKDSIVGGVYFIIFFTTASQIKDEKSFNQLMWVLIVMGIIEAVITVAQVKIGFTLPGKWRLTNLEGVDVSEEFRADGTTSHPILLAHYLQFTIMVGVAGFFWSRSVVFKVLLFMGILLMVVAWYYAFSRTSFIAMAVTTGIYFFIKKKVWRIVITGSGLAFVLLLILLKIQSFEELLSVIEGLNIFSRSLSSLDINSGQDSYGFRAEQFYAAWRLFLDHPVIGVGYEQANPRYMPYLPYWATNASHPQVIHNIFFKVLTEQGLVGITVFIGLWAYAFKSIKKAWFDKQYGRYAQLVFFIMIAQLVMAGMNPMMREIWLSLGMAAAIGKLVKEKERSMATSTENFQV